MRCHRGRSPGDRYMWQSVRHPQVRRLYSSCLANNAGGMSTTHNKSRMSLPVAGKADAGRTNA
jgi:hypothetical protein